MAASADRDTPMRHPEGGVRRVIYPVKAATTIYKGTIVALNAGYAAPAADTAALIVVGIAEEKVVNAGADGALGISVICGAAFRLAGASIVAATVGATAMVSDDSTVTTAAVAANDIPVGFVEELEAANICWVYIGKVS